MVERTAAKLRRNARNWRLTRENLEKLTILAYEFGYEHGIFEIRHHPLWSTFANSNVTLYRGDQVSDAKVEADIREFLSRIHARQQITLVNEATPAVAKAIADAMRGTNCIFIGSPRHNPATEIALALLWSAKPFDSNAANREKLPFHMIRSDGVPETAVISRGKHAGFDVRSVDGRKNCLVPVSWLAADEYNKWSGEGNDAAMVAICRSPLNSARPVTSIVICGYTGLATKRVAHELIAGEPPLTASDLERAGDPRLLGYSFAFSKPRGQRRAGFGDQRKFIERTGRWAPPWDEIAEF